MSKISFCGSRNHQTFTEAVEVLFRFHSEDGNRGAPRVQQIGIDLLHDQGVFRRPRFAAQSSQLLEQVALLARRLDRASTQRQVQRTRGRTGLRVTRASSHLAVAAGPRIGGGGMQVGGRAGEKGEGFL